VRTTARVATCPRPSSPCPLQFVAARAIGCVLSQSSASRPRPPAPAPAPAPRGRRKQAGARCCESSEVHYIAAPTDGTGRSEHGDSTIATSAGTSACLGGSVRWVASSSRRPHRQQTSCSARSPLPTQVGALARAYPLGRACSTMHTVQCLCCPVYLQQERTVPRAERTLYALATRRRKRLCSLSCRDYGLTPVSIEAFTPCVDSCPRLARVTASFRACS
jgi:hypothetical protein